MKLNIGPAATVAARAQMGAPCMVRRKAAASISDMASPSLPLAASASPENFTKPPKGKAAICQTVPRLSTRLASTGPNPIENTSA